MNHADNENTAGAGYLGGKLAAAQNHEAKLLITLY